MTKSIDELNKEMEEARAKYDLAVAEARKVKEAEEKKLRNEAQAKKVLIARERYSVYANCLIEELKKAGYTDAEWAFRDGDGEPRTWNIQPNIYPKGQKGQEDWVRIQFAESYGNYGSKDVIYVGGYERTRFPLKKDGTFNYKGIVAKFVQKENVRIVEKQERIKKNNLLDTNERLAKSIRERFGIDSYSGIVRANQYTEGKVLITIKASLEEAEAIAMLTALRDAGIELK